LKEQVMIVVRGEDDNNSATTGSGGGGRRRSSAAGMIMMNDVVSLSQPKQQQSTSTDGGGASSVQASSFSPLEIEDTGSGGGGGGGGGDNGSGGGGSCDDDDELVYPLVHHHSTDSTDDDGIRPSKGGSHRAHDDHHGAGPPAGTATSPQVIINVVISFVGAGLLGIPNAFAQSGWVLGSITLLCVSALNVYAMLCLPVVQTTLQRSRPNETIQTYGDVGRVVLGDNGEKAVFICLGISQAGFATAYIIFIAANLHSITNVPRGIICFVCIPGLALLVQFRDLKSLSPFSLLANTANFCALSAVLFQDYES
jgi:hypothetical protein